MTAAAPGPRTAPPPAPPHHPKQWGGASYLAAGHGEARQGTASSATPPGFQPGPAGGQRSAAGVSGPAAPPPLPLPPPFHNHNNMAAAATQSAPPTPSRVARRSARTRHCAQLAVRQRRQLLQIERRRGRGFRPRPRMWAWAKAGRMSQAGERLPGAQTEKD